jgi:metal-responsive CopG/Arc/MetJ family transcriptional regulator
MFPDDMVQLLDNIAREEKTSRSKLLREAIQYYIEEYQHTMEDKKKRERIRMAIKTQDRLREKSGKWDGVTEIRKWREAI